MGDTTLYAPQSIRTQHQTDFVHRVISTVSSWFGHRQSDTDADTLNAELRRDIGLAPVERRAEPSFVAWLP